MAELSVNLWSSDCHAREYLARADSIPHRAEGEGALLEGLEARFASDAAVTIIGHDLECPLSESLGSFDAVVSSFAIHHLGHARKRALYEEAFDRLRPGGAF